MCALAANRKAVVYASWVHLELGTITAAQRTRTTTVRFPFELHINRKNTQTVEHRLLSNRHGQNEAPPQSTKALLQVSSHAVSIRKTESPLLSVVNLKVLHFPDLCPMVTGNSFILTPEIRASSTNLLIPHWRQWKVSPQG